MPESSIPLSDWSLMISEILDKTFIVAIHAYALKHSAKHSLLHILSYTLQNS